MATSLGLGDFARLAPSSLGLGLVSFPKGAGFELPPTMAVLIDGQKLSAIGSDAENGASETSGDSSGSAPHVEQIYSTI